GGNGPANSGFIYLALKPLEQRKKSASDVINELRPKLASVPGATVFVQAGQDLRIGGRQSSSQYQYTIQSDNLDDLVQWGPILLHATTGPVVPLSAVAKYDPTTAPIAVNHQGQFPSVTLSFNIAPGMALSDAVERIAQMEQNIGMPGRIHGSYSGTLQAFQSSLASMPFLIITALAAVYIVLGILYESIIHPFTIL